MPTLAAFNLKEKATGDLYHRCPCGCEALVDKPIVFNSAAEAIEFAKYKELKGHIPVIFVDDSWKSRELDKFRTGAYQVPVWWNDEWFKPIKDEHFNKFYPHVSKTSPDKISFTETPEKGMQDIQTVIAPGRYLKRFFGKILSADQITELANRHTEEWGKALELKIAATGEEIAEVYQRTAGFTSCMQKPISSFYGHLNPTYIYGMGDAVLGYIEDKHGKLLARALMWPEKRLVGRVYGDAYRLRAAVKSKFDFETSSDNNNYDKLDNARIDNILFGSVHVGPYIDGGLSVIENLDGSLQMVLRPDTKTAYLNNFGGVGSQTGIFGNGHIPDCANCGNTLKGNYYRVFSSEKKKDYGVWCKTCMRNHAVRVSDGDNFTFFNRNGVSCITINEYGEDGEFKGNVYVLANEASKYTRDPFTGHYIPKDLAVQINNGMYIVDKRALKAMMKDGLAFTSGYDGAVYTHAYEPDKYQPMTVDGQLWTKQQAKKYAGWDEDKMAYVRIPENHTADVELEDL